MTLSFSDSPSGTVSWGVLGSSNKAFFKLDERTLCSFSKSLISSDNTFKSLKTSSAD
jgi:hypothetical protein